jgi:hypothetical protein
MEPSATKRSFKVFAVCEEDGSRFFVGLIARKELARLLRGEISHGCICKFAQTPTARKVGQETLNHALKIALADPSKLGAPQQ